MNNENVLATQKFVVEGTTVIGTEIRSVVTAFLLKNKSFQYGNQTMIVFKWDYGYKEAFDTRYEPVTLEDFPDYSKILLESILINTIEVRFAD